MLQFNKWKAFSIFAIIIAGIVMALPNVLPENVRKGMPAFLPSSPMTLGLDLRGGAHLVFELDEKSLRKVLTTQLRGDVRQVLFTDNKIKHKISRGSGGEVIVAITDANKVEQAGKVLQQLARPVNTGFFGQGADVPEIDVVQTGDRFALSYSEQGLVDRMRRTVEQSISVLGNRLNPDGTLELTIQRQGDDRILVQVPGVDDTRRLEDLANQPGQLQFQTTPDDWRYKPG